jgi:MOSC domain-containing protein YiiM
MQGDNVVGQLVSVNVSDTKIVEHRGRQITTGIFKTPVTGPVSVAGVNIAGDTQADLTAHGGTDKAVYAYATEDIAWWEGETGRTIAPATFGENLTTADIDVSDAVVGERWRVGTVLLEVSEPRVPCFKLGIAMGDGKFPLLFKRADRPGSYLRIIETGILETGDTIEVVARPGNSISVADIARIYDRDHDEAERLLGVPGLSDPWKAWAQRQISP